MRVTQFLSPNEPSSTGNGLHLIELLAKGHPWETTQAIAKTLGGSPQTDSKALLHTPT